MPGPLTVTPPVPPLGGVPVGTILAYVGPLNTLPDSWRLCDGSQVNDAQSPFNGQTLPRITDNRFLMGVEAAQSVNQAGGRNDIPQAGSHNHGVNTGTPRDSVPDSHGFDADERNQPPAVTGIDHRHRISLDGAHNHEGENRPQFLGVFFIIRIK